MSITRRKVLGSGAGLGAVVVAGGSLLTSAGPAYAGAVEDLIAEFTGGAAVGSGGVSLGAPQIAENGNTVPVSVSSDGAVSEVMVVATKNPSPGVVRFKFSAMSGSATPGTSRRSNRCSCTPRTPSYRARSLFIRQRVQTITLSCCSAPQSMILSRSRCQWRPI